MFDFLSPFHTIFTGILLQALPFLLLGALLSSGLRVFVSDSALIKLFPKKYGIGFATALFAGLLFPVCECAAVPLMRSLIKKGVAMPIAVTFMLASPLINPISILSTLYAFPQQPSVALYRLYFGLTISLGIGLLLLFYPKEKYLREDFESSRLGTSQSGVNQPDTTAQQENKRSFTLNRLQYYTESAADPALFPAAGSNSTLKTVMNIAAGRTATEPRPYERLSQKIYALFIHTCSEFFTAGPFLIIGAFVTALIRTAVPQRFFSMAGKNTGTALLVMMLFAFVFSACSTSDALIVRSFANRFPLPAILGFLVYGPMMDVKNLAMLLTLFKKRFVIELTVIITVGNFIGISILTHVFLP